MTEIKQPPLRATLHCRHYNYVPGDGPSCQAGEDISGSGAIRKCMPPGEFRGDTACAVRQEFTSDERQAWTNWAFGGTGRLLAVLPLIPGSKKKADDREFWGKAGTFSCPNCKGGTVRWVRALSNGHVAASCSTKHCVQFMQ